MKENKKLREEEVRKVKGAKHKICDVEEKKGNQMLINFQHKLDKGEECRLTTLESKHIPEGKGRRNANIFCAKNRRAWNATCSFR